jgi:hypothetical protein
MILANTQIWLVAGITDMRWGTSAACCRVRSIQVHCQDKSSSFAGGEVTSLNVYGSTVTDYVFSRTNCLHTTPLSITSEGLVSFLL